MTANAWERQTGTSRKCRRQDHAALARTEDSPDLRTAQSRVNSTGHLIRTNDRAKEINSARFGGAELIAQWVAARVR
jgi:hypothetical protein